MSFNVSWESFGKESLTEWTKELLTDSLNSGKRPNVLASQIQIKDLNFGKIAPSFEILEIGELAKDRFRGIFKISYSGDFHLTLHTKVQANPLNIYNSIACESGGSFATPNFLMSSEPFSIPLDLKLSDIKLSGIAVIVFSKTKGLTLVFRNEPLDSIKVSSTFDTIKVLARFLQNQIEIQISDLFRETLPSVIHKLSLKWVDNNKNDLKDLHSQLKEKLNEMDEKVSINDINPELPFTLSPNNMSKLSTILSSRESLALFSPLMENIIQRSNTERFSKNLPSLVNSLNLSTNSLNYNSIPIELLMSNPKFENSLQSFFRIDNTVYEISKIQSKSYQRLNNNSKPKRRTVKLNKKNKGELKKDIIQPVPVKVQYPESIPSESETLVEGGCNSENDKPKTDLAESQKSVVLQNENELQCSTPTSSMSLISGVGLGNNYFNFANSHNNVTLLDIDEPKSKNNSLKTKKSNNHIDIDTINKKLLHLKLSKANKEDLRTSLSRSFKKLEFNSNRLNDLVHEMPPPYHV